MCKLKLFLNTLFFVWILGGLYSCSENDILLEDTEESMIIRTCSLSLNINVQQFDNKKTRSEENLWKEGDRIYISFNKDCYGIADFKSGKWQLMYNGDLQKNEVVSCKLYYFDNPEFNHEYVVKPGPLTGIYTSEEATYFFNGESMMVEGRVSPFTGRMRFKGAPDSKILVDGISYYMDFSLLTGVFSKQRNVISLTVKEDGYTPYIYGFFNDSIRPRINIITSDNGFTREFPKSIFKKGTSGWILIPTTDSYTNWLNHLNVIVDSVDFVLLPVVGKEKNDSYSFFMGKTEVTKEMYNCILGKESEDSLSLYPVYDVSYVTFLDALTKVTGLHFRLPTKEEWLYAAKGGSKSRGYKYSGSDIAETVAWYYANSNNKVHEVALLAPNELGFYDMSGNVCEWTSSEVKISVGTNNNRTYRVYCGGDYESPEGALRSSFNDYQNSDNHKMGFRLTLSENIK